MNYLSTTTIARRVYDKKMSNGSLDSWLFGNKRRLFVNPALGCRSSCSYCYLPTVGILIGPKAEIIPPPIALVEKVVTHSEFQRGKTGTLLSFGCYTECMAPTVLNNTLRLVEGLTPFENPIQIATKREISENTLATLDQSQAWNGQVSIFVSCSTVTHWQKYESGTSPPNNRFLVFSMASRFSIPMYLYIKPFLPKVTEIDFQLFARIASENNVSVIVGAPFDENQIGQEAPIGEGRLFSHEPFGYTAFFNKMSDKVKTYKTSVEALWVAQNDR